MHTIDRVEVEALLIPYGLLHGPTHIVGSMHTMEALVVPYGLLHGPRHIVVVDPTHIVGRDLFTPSYPNVEYAESSDLSVRAPTGSRSL